MIIYFSGTGNSRHCAQRLAALTADSDVRELSPDMLRHPASRILDIAEGDKRVVWVFPTYSWGVPPVVANFINKTGLGRNAMQAQHFMLTTCGDDMAYTDRQWRHLLERRGISCATAFAIEMPNTYTLMKGFDVDAPEVSARKLAASEARLADIAHRIINGGESSLIRGAFAWFKSWVIYPWFKRYAMSSEPFHATGGCTGCGLCVRSCPMSNMTMTAGRPVWGSHCALCLRCYHTCPRHAVAYGKATDGKGQWMYPSGKTGK